MPSMAGVFTFYAGVVAVIAWSKKFARERCNPEFSRCLLPFAMCCRRAAT
jgi:uncharacterized membrane protein